MKIIKEGQSPEKKLPDYVGQALTCKRCGAQIVLEEGDSIGAVKCPGGRRWCSCPTPGCGAEIDILPTTSTWNQFK